jgi:hypothetical protein
MTSKPARTRVAAHRAALRRQGLRPIQIWVPDTRAPGFAEEALRQSRLVAARPDAQEVMDFLERISILDDEDEAGDAAG